MYKCSGFRRLPLNPNWTIDSDDRCCCPTEDLSLIAVKLKHDPEYKTIALIEWNSIGHYPIYLQLFAKALLELGCRVVVLSAKPDELRFDDPSLFPNDLVKRLTVLQCQRLPSFRFVPSRYREQVAQIRTFRYASATLREWETTQNTQIDLVFFASIDDTTFSYFHRAWRWNSRPWSGLYLHCRAFRKPGTPIPNYHGVCYPCPERIFKAPMQRSIAILDEAVTDQVERLSGTPVIVFPDLATNEVHSRPAPLVNKLVRLAEDRPIVGSLGFLQRTKGSGDLARIAERDSVRHIMFAFVGELSVGTFNNADVKRLKSLNESLENAFTHFSAVEEFDDVCRCCDVLYLAYLDFPSSSNMLAKAALFEKPVIVSDGSLMAERTREYRLGEVIPEGDLEAAECAILMLTSDLPGWTEENQPRWKEYREHHSYTTLKERFSILLAASQL